MVLPDLLSKVRATLATRKSNRVRGQGLAESLAKQLSMPVMDVREALYSLHENNELQALDWHVQMGPQGMVTLNLDIQADPVGIAWGEAMRIAGISLADMKHLMPAAGVLSDMMVTDLVAVAKGLIHLRDCKEKHYGESRFVVSARYLIGSSKMLDALPNAALKAFGIDPARFPDAPAYVITAGSSDPRVVVLVENPQAFELAVKAAVPGVAWMTTYGYGLSRSGDAYGAQLAAIIESGQMIALVRDGSPPSLKQMIDHPNLTFWGDLDPAGLHIFHRLQCQLRQLHLSSLYQPMIERLKSGHGHPYTKATGKEGQSLQVVSDVTAKTLLDLCSERGVDQEAVQEDDFKFPTETLSM